jgi:NADPH:quinone reductase-like Zn-dependent oxidoreductase
VRAVIIPQHGGIEVLSYVSDYPTPTPGPGEALIRVHAGGINQIDRFVRAGYPGIGITLPHIPGGDAAGVLEALGPDTQGPPLGTRVVAYPLGSCGQCQLCAEGKPNLCLKWQYLGLHRHGGYAEYTVVPAAALVPLPDAVGFQDAVCLPIAGLTALHALKTVGGLRAGQSFFIWGGSGALGTLAIQIGKQLGATVIATAGSAEKLEMMRALGADLVLNRREDDVPARVADICPAGVDVALDYVGPETFNTTIGMLKKGGELLFCGMMTGRETSFNIQQAYLKHISVKGLYLGTREEMTEVTAWMAEGRIKAQIAHVFPLEQAAEAQRLLESGAYFGKIVLDCT